MAERYWMLCSRLTRMALYSSGIVFIYSSKNTRSRPPWNSPAMAVNTMIGITWRVLAVTLHRALGALRKEMDRDRSGRGER